MFSKVLVATDLSEMSEHLIWSLGDLRKLGTREMLLIHCINIRDIGSLANKVIEMSMPTLEKQKQLLENQGFKVSADIVLGLPQIEINRQAEEHNCSMITVGSHGESAAADIFIGSIASAIIHNTRKPTLILPSKLKESSEKTFSKESHNEFLRSVLYPTDFSDNAENAFEYVKKLAECGAEKITLMHVQDKVHIEKHLENKLKEFNRIDQNRLDRLKNVLQGYQVRDIRTEISYGNPKKTIIDFIKRQDISLVVMGSQGRGAIEELFIGSVSHSVIRNSNTAVLLIPALR